MIRAVPSGRMSKKAKSKREASEADPANEGAGPEMGFEASMDEVESIIESIETGALGLDASIDAYERGVKLLGRCREALSSAEQRVEDLTSAVRALETGSEPARSGGESRDEGSGADVAGA